MKLFFKVLSIVTCLAVSAPLIANKRSGKPERDAAMAIAIVEQLRLETVLPDYVSAIDGVKEEPGKLLRLRIEFEKLKEAVSHGDELAQAQILTVLQFMLYPLGHTPNPGIPLDEIDFSALDKYDRDAIENIKRENFRVRTGSEENRRAYMNTLWRYYQTAKQRDWDVFKSEYNSRAWQWIESKREIPSAGCLPL